MKGLLLESKKIDNLGAPDGFIDDTVYRYRLKPDGTKEFIGTMQLRTTRSFRAVERETKG